MFRFFRWKFQSNVMKVSSESNKQTWTWSNNAFEGTVVNRAMPSFHEGSLEIKFTIPLRTLVLTLRFLLFRGKNLFLEISFYTSSLHKPINCWLNKRWFLRNKQNSEQNGNYFVKSEWLICSDECTVEKPKHETQRTGKILSTFKI